MILVVIGKNIRGFHVEVPSDELSKAEPSLLAREGA